MTDATMEIPVTAPPPTTERMWKEAVDAYLVERSSELLTSHHLAEIRRVLLKVDRDIGPVSPAAFSVADVTRLLQGPLADSSGRHKVYTMTILRGFLRSCGNPVLDKLRLRIPQAPIRPRHALEGEELARVLTACTGKDPWVRAMVCLEATMGLRRSEALRVRWSDVREGQLVFVGKGRLGGKLRTVPVSALVRELFPVIRVEGVETMLSCVDRSGSRIRITRTRADEALTDVFWRAGIRVPGLHHVLRRTFGHALWRSGVPIEVIARLYGHEDTKTTLAYLSITGDDDKRAMEVIDSLWGQL